MQINTSVFGTGEHGCRCQRGATAFTVPPQSHSWLRLAPELCWRRRQRSDGGARELASRRGRSCAGVASSSRCALAAVGMCGAHQAILFDRIENSRRQLEKCNFLLHNPSEAWYLRLLALNFLRRHVNNYFRVWWRAAPAVCVHGGPLHPRSPLRVPSVSD